MSCLTCFEAVGLKQSKAAKRQEVRARIIALQSQLEATEDDFHRKKENREELLRQVEDAKKRAEDLQKDDTAQRGGTFSWLTGIFSSQPSFSEEHVNKLQEDLSASRDALQQMEAQRMELESKVELAEATEMNMGNGEKADEAPASGAVVASDKPATPFGQVRSALREKTPMDMREEEETLKRQLQSIKEEIHEEEKLHQEAHHEKMQHETTAMAIEVEKRSKSWKEQLTPKKQFSFGFRSETPPRQKEIKEKLNAHAQELLDAQAKAADERKAHGELLRKLSTRSQISSNGSQNSFAFGAGK